MGRPVRLRDPKTGRSIIDYEEYERPSNANPIEAVALICIYGALFIVFWMVLG